jgi:hypothetical protein
VRFFHGLGDCAYFAHMSPLYLRRGHAIEVECTPDKRLLFEAAGARVVSTASQTHDWGYPAGSTYPGQGQFWQGSKMGHNLSELPLPGIGRKEELWDEYCQERIDISAKLPSGARDLARRWLERLPRPVVLLHSKGNTAQERKSLPDAVVAQFYRSFLDQCDGSLILLDWDKRVPRLDSYRVRHLDDFGTCPVDVLVALMLEADLMIGVDSGPLHLARFTSVPTIGVWMPGHYPSTYSLPRHEQLNVVLADPTRQWNRFKRVPWNIVEHPGGTYSAERLADFCRRMLAPPRYLTKERQAADVQLQQFVQEFCRSREGSSAYWDRNRSFDLVLQEASRRFERPAIVETGTIRAEEDWPGAGFFTYLAGSYAHHRGGKLCSVDLSAEHVAFARQWTAVFGDAVQVTQQNSVAFLKSSAEPIDLLYLDSLDATEPGHAEHCLRELETALPRLHERSLIVIDDTPWKHRAWAGKGALAAPWLLQHGWKLLYGGYQVVFSR